MAFPNPGQAIDDYCDAMRLTLKERLDLFCDVCEAVDYAHRNLVIHRDIKPDNIIVSRDGRAKLLDFGIARLLDDSNRAEPTREKLTPQYASPEQFQGGPITTLSDVFSLGVLLCRLLIGRTPFENRAEVCEIKRLVCEGCAKSPSQMIVDTHENSHLSWSGEQVSWARRTTPSRLYKSLRGDLDAIVHKAMRPNPAARFASPRELAEDLRRFLQRQPVTARPESSWYRARRSAARNPILTATGLVAIAAILTGFIASTRLNWLADEALLSERSQKQLAESRLEENVRLTEELRKKQTESELLRLTAEQRLSALQEFSSQTVFDLFAVVDQLEGSERARAKILQIGLDSLEKVRDETRFRPNFLRTLIAAYAKLGGSQVEIPFSEPGVVENMLRCVNQAVTLSVELLEDDAGDLRNRSIAARALSTRGNVLWVLGRAKQAIEDYREAIDILVDLNEPCVSPGDLYARGAAFGRLAQWELEMGGSEEFHELAEESIRIQMQAAKRFPDLRHIHINDANCVREMCALHALLEDDPETALEWSSLSLKEYKELGGPDLSNVDVESLNRSRQVHARCLIAAGFPIDAGEILECLLERHASRPLVAETLHNVLIDRIDLDRVRGDWSSAASRADHAYESIHRMNRENGVRPPWLRAEVHLLERLVESHLELGNSQKAQEALTKQEGVLREWEDAHPRFPGQAQCRMRMRFAEVRVRVALSGADASRQGEIHELLKLEGDLKQSLHWLEDERILDQVRVCRQRYEEDGGFL